jgi:hypothetical protein
MVIPLELREPLRQYNEARGLKIFGMLGSGKDGCVVSVSRPSSPLFVSAAKVFFHPTIYKMEREAYFRLRECKVYRENGFNVPQLIDYDDGLSALEISIVAKPRILDFASVFLDFPADFDDERLAEYRDKIVEHFEDRASDVFSLLDKLERDYGIWYYDARPGNIDFDEP